MHALPFVTCPFLATCTCICLQSICLQSNVTVWLSSITCTLIGPHQPAVNRHSCCQTPYRILLADSKHDQPAILGFLLTDCWCKEDWLPSKHSELGFKNPLTARGGSDQPQSSHVNCLERPMPRLTGMCNPACAAAMWHTHHYCCAGASGGR